MILIIGYGNPLRGDDALGQVAARRLAQFYVADPRVDVRNLQQLTPEIAETLSAYASLILIDARRTAPPGQLLVERVWPADECVVRSFTHYVSPEELLLLAERLYEAQPRTYLVSVGGEDFTVGAPLSPVVQAALPELYRRVAELVEGD